MSKYLLTGLVLAILGTSWILYLKYENNQFAENLPEPPQREQKISEPQNQQPLIHEPPPPTLSVELESKSVEPKAVPNPEVKKPLPESKSDSHKMETPDTHAHEKKDKQQTVPPRDLSEMSAEEISKSVRNRFLAKTKGEHRDEIETVARLMPKLIRRDEHMSLKERYEFQKALTILNPTPLNEEGLRVMEERMRKHAEHPVDIPRPSEHVKPPSNER